MRRSVRNLLFLLVPGVAVPAGASAPSGGGAIGPGFLLGLPVPTVLSNLAFAFFIVFLFVLGVYAYVSLARFAPYRTWIYLYLASLTGFAWAFFLANDGIFPPDAIFILITVAGINVIVHILRFDRVELSLSGRAQPAGFTSTS